MSYSEREFINNEKEYLTVDYGITGYSIFSSNYECLFSTHGVISRGVGCNPSRYSIINDRIYFKPAYGLLGLETGVADWGPLESDRYFKAGQYYIVFEPTGELGRNVVQDIIGDIESLMKLVSIITALSEEKMEIKEIGDTILAACLVAEL